MEMYCVSCKKNIANEISSVKRFRQNRFILFSNCALSGKKNSRFIKSQEVH